MKHILTVFASLILTLCLAFVCPVTTIAAPPDPLAHGFVSPPQSARPLTWWHWLDGNLTSNGITADLALEPPVTKENFYRDLAVIAFPAPQGTLLTGRGTDTVLRGSVKDAELSKLVDGKPETRSVFPEATSGHTVEFVFSSPRTVRSLVCRDASPHKWEENFAITMEVSSDGKNFHRVGAFTANWDFAEGGQITAACDEATGTVFRITSQLSMRS